MSRKNTSTGCMDNCFINSRLCPSAPDWPEHSMWIACRTNSSRSIAERGAYRFVEASSDPGMAHRKQPDFKLSKLPQKCRQILQTCSKSHRIPASFTCTKCIMGGTKIILHPINVRKRAKIQKYHSRANVQERIEQSSCSDAKGECGRTMHVILWW